VGWGCYEVLVLLHAITNVPSWQVVKVLSASHCEESWEPLDSHSGSIAAPSLHFKPRRRVTNDMARFEATTALLGNAETYTSAALMSDTYDRAVGTVKSDQSGTLYVEQSGDGTNWDVSQSIAVTGGAGQSFSVALVAAYFRTRYVNGATPQTSFRLRVGTNSDGAHGS
jgi:hypothetical protein